jgi:TPR repeat protein
VRQDVKKAIALFKQGADANQPEAMTSVGDVHVYLRNFAEAKYWYERAAALGYEEAQEKLQKLREALASAPSPDALFPLPFPLPFQELPRTSRRSAPLPSHN